MKIGQWVRILESPAYKNKFKGHYGEVKKIYSVPGYHGHKARCGVSIVGHYHENNAHGLHWFEDEYLEMCKEPFGENGDPVDRGFFTRRDSITSVIGACEDPFQNVGPIKDVIYNPPATIILWNDGTKTVVKCDESEDFDWEKGLAMAIAKKHLGNKGNYYHTFKQWEPEPDPEYLATMDKLLELFSGIFQVPRSKLTGEKDKKEVK